MRAAPCARGRFGVVPVVNENDAVANEELRLGDNDTLAALVANLIEADLLVLLTDQQGACTMPIHVPTRATLVSHAMAGDSAGWYGRRWRAARSAAACRPSCARGNLPRARAMRLAIAYGRTERVCSVSGWRRLRTLADAVTPGPDAARKRWLAGQLAGQGEAGAGRRCCVRAA